MGKIRASRRLGMLLLVGLTMGGWGLCREASAQQTPDPTISWGYFQGAVSSPGAIIGTQSSLSALIPAHIKFVQINSGVAALAAMRAGSFQAVEGVGNPPVVSALAAHTPLLVVFAESYDGAGLYVNTNRIQKTSDLAGQSIGDLVGSSEDYELKGYLRQNGLIDKVRVVPFASDSAAAAAYLTGNLNAVYVDFGAGVPVDEPSRNQGVDGRRKDCRDGLSVAECAGRIPEACNRQQAVGTENCLRRVSGER